MNLLVDLPILKKLIEKKSNPYGDDLYDLYFRIFSNKKNKFILSKKYIEILEPVLIDFSNEPVAKSILHEMMDRKTPIENTVNSIHDNIESQIKLLFQEFKKPEPIIIITNNENKTQFTELKSNIFCGEEEAKSIIQIFLKNILENSIAIVNYFDFASDNEISEFFQALIRYLKYANEIYIYDRDFKLEQNNNLDFLLNIRTKHIYTKSEDQGHNYCILKDKIKEIQRKYKGTYSIFVTKKEQIHERRLLLSSFIIESNHDFSMIKKSNSTWVITISEDKENINRHKEKNVNFSQVTL